MYCDPKKDKTRLIKAPAGTSCDDGDFCTGESVCVQEDKHNMKCAAKNNTKGPCGDNFCQSICNSKTRQCESPCTESSCRSKPTCTAGLDGQGTCGTIPLAVPPNCTSCPCDADGATNMVCNPISGMCHEPAQQHLRVGSEYKISILVGGIAGAVMVLSIVFVAMVCIARKQNLSNWMLRAIFYKTNDEAAEVRFINKSF